MELIDTEYKLQKKKKFSTAMPSQFPLHLKNCFFMKGKKFMKNLHACSLVIVIALCHFLLHHPYNYRYLLTGFFGSNNLMMI